MGYKKIQVHLIFDVKHDGRHKARLVADGHLTDIPLESVCSGVVSLQGFRIVLFLAELNHLKIWATDIDNAYLEALTSEKVYIIAGSEFVEREGHILIISRALYVL
jgi:Reverse transcriptase (RNA-dependent DNA polymerase)